MASKNILQNENYNGNQIQNAALHPLGAFPSSPVNAQVCTVGGVAYVYNGSLSLWVPCDARQLPAGSLPLSLLATDPLARANHTGFQPASTINNLAAVVQAYSLSSFAAPTAPIPMNGQTLTGLPAPTGPGQPAEYSWTIGVVQSAAAGIVSKVAVRAVATSAITLSGTQTVDTVALAVGDRVAVVAQGGANAAHAQNGPWIVQTGAWTRPTDEGATAELDPGATWLVLAGANAGTSWRLSTQGSITPGTTAVTILLVQFGQTYTAGSGLTGTNTFSVLAAAGGGILVAPGGVSVDPAVVTRKQMATIGDGSSASFTIPHTLATTDVQVEVWTMAAPMATVEVDVQRPDTSHVIVTVTTAPAANSLRVSMQG